MSGLFHDLTRRGVHHIHQSGTLRISNQNFAETYKMPIWGIVMLASTAALFFLIMSTIEYTFGRLIPTLLMVETPQALLFEPLQSIEPDAPLDSKTDSKAPNTDSELLLVKQKPITASFRTTIKHLRAKAGVWSRFRGLAIFLVHASLLNSLTNVLNVPLMPFGLAPVVAAIILANISLAWTHIVISAPSPKRWYQRLPTARTWKKVALPTAVLAIAEQVTVLVPAGLAMVIGIPHPKDTDKLSNAERQVLIVKGFAVVGVAVALAFLLVVPANVILTRVQASLLNDEEETIVPFDRSFGGKVVPEIVGGSGAIGMVEAWKTFDWNARVRLIKAYVKVTGMQIALSVLFFGVIVGEILLIVGKSDLKKLFPVDGKKGN